MRRACALVICWLAASNVSAQSLPGTQPLEMKGDLARHMLNGIDKYLTRQIAIVAKEREKYWNPDYSSAGAYDVSVKTNRDRLKKILGVVDARVPVTMEYVATESQPALLAETDAYRVQAVRWPVLPGVYGEGLLLEPKGKTVAAVVAIPDADQTPELIAGLAPGLDPDAQFARVLAEQGCRVLVPTLINRQDKHSQSEQHKRFTNQTHREFVYRMAYQMGRHIIGYEVQKVLAGVDWFAQKKDRLPIGVFGYGEGGSIALYSAALDTRIQSTVVSGHFGPREDVHNESIYRNVWSQLKHFGDGDVIRLIVPRGLQVEQAAFATGDPPAARQGRSGAAPGTFAVAPMKSVVNEIDRVMSTVPKEPNFPRQSVGFWWEVSAKGNITDANVFRGPGFDGTYTAFLKQLRTDFKKELGKPIEVRRKSFDPDARQKRQFDQLVEFTQKLLPESKHRRQEFFWSKLDTSSLDKFKKSQEPLRDYFSKEIIGQLPEPNVPPNPRTRLLYDTPKWSGYEVVLDVYEEVISYGILLVPKGMKPSEKRPCIVCQHGLEGRPTDVCDPTKKTQYYNSFGAQLADQGFVVFAPQNPYIFKNDFRQVVRKANPMQLTLYSFIVRQHQRILDWLKTLDFVDGSRIAYYGLSYGGKVAMRIPAILLDYCLSICSGDFNEWIWKNITLEWSNSYMFSGEYEMYEFDLGNTFNYAEMAALIAPRPFMVERGHADPVGLDEYVAFEFAKVRRFYAQLGIADRTEIEWFSGGHEINLRGTLAFLKKHLQFPK
ncbi:MAG: dienelactone hydrolase family protein [Gemmataceae bacterium]|nr:dienelactone hydrolase family protein [Gemmataceae bacterium]MCI0738553.1 dienelactone hydrolase family protein [Gemmataceae bacterium]